MKKKTKKHMNPSDISENNSSGGKSKKEHFEGNVAMKDKDCSVLSSSINESTEGLVTIEKGSEKKKLKKSKWEKIEHTKFIEKSHNNSIYDEENPLPRKKQKKLESIDADQYKPGMLSDLLQKKKYGCLILPWEKSFGNNHPQSGLASETEQKPIIKMNPLFDISKTSEGNLAPKSLTYMVFVGNLPQEVTVNQVKKIFKKLGNTISKIKIRSEERKKHKTLNSSKQNDGTIDQYKHALVKFSSLESYNAALKMNGKLYNGRHLRVTGAKGETSSDPEKSVFVGNLAVGTSDDDLWRTFESCGEIESVRVIRDKLNKKGKFGYVNFKSNQSIDEALELDGTTVLEREIRVSRINRNSDSLSNSITVKRNKKKRTKPQLIFSGNGVKSSNTANPSEEKKGKSRKPLKHKTINDLETEIKPGIPTKKKKKKNPVDAVESKTDKTD